MQYLKLECFSPESYLVFEFAVLQKSQLVLSVQASSINVVEIHLKTNKNAITILFFSYKPTLKVEN